MLYLQFKETHLKYFLLSMISIFVKQIFPLVMSCSNMWVVQNILSLTRKVSEKRDSFLLFLNIGPLITMPLVQRCSRIAIQSWDKLASSSSKYPSKIANTLVGFEFRKRESWWVRRKEQQFKTIDGYLTFWNLSCVKGRVILKKSNICP